MMNALKLTLSLWLVLLTVICCSKSKNAPVVEPPAKNFMVVGYMFASGDLNAAAAKVDFDRITHLNIAFINPESNGQFLPVTGLAGAIAKAHAKKVKVLFSFGGGNPPVHLKELVKPAQRTAFIASLVKLATDNNFDGVDVDLEGDFIDANYEAFVVELASALKPSKKLLTAAVATWNGNTISAKALAQYDFINIMSYDQTGPWNKANAGPHSTYEAAVNDIHYWNVTRGIPAAKLNLGLPFYGYGFGPDIAESMTYGEIVKTYAGSENNDLVEIPGKGTMYYNGKATISRKMTLAMNKSLGGVMIWQLFGDAEGANSLLNVIHQNKK